MLCRNTKWHETAATRKKFDNRMRKYFINEEELQAVRNWTGILREKTLFDAAISRASYLKVLDLGTMVAEVCFVSDCFLLIFFSFLNNFFQCEWCSARAEHCFFLP